jgi:hypothetical protein
VTIALPLWLILGAVMWMAWRYMGLRAWHAVVCVLLGFLLAATAAAPEIRQVVNTVIGSYDQDRPHHKDNP